jgi:hypothetical protein
MLAIVFCEIAFLPSCTTGIDKTKFSFKVVHLDIGDFFEYCKWSAKSTSWQRRRSLKYWILGK